MDGRPSRGNDDLRNLIVTGIMGQPSAAGLSWIAARDIVDRALALAALPSEPPSDPERLDVEAQLAAALDETQRMLEYLWGATGNRAPDLPVSDLFNEDDPITDDVMTVVGKARLVLHSNGYARLNDTAPEPSDG